MADTNLSSFIWSVADLLRGDASRGGRGLKDILLNHSDLYERLRADI